MNENIFRQKSIDKVKSPETLDDYIRVSNPGIWLLLVSVIVIAHRLSTIQHADRIIYLDGGKIVEDETYDELIAKNGYFAGLVERQRLDVEYAE